jgi:N-dimethylarginine dimethylaminohydrolase
MTAACILFCTVGNGEHSNAHASCVRPFMHRVLLCPPEFYEVRYEINAWMSVADTPDHDLAVKQWEGLRECLLSIGCEVECLQPQPGWPDMVFTANAGVVRGNRVLLSNFRHEERSGESPWNESWFSQHGYEVTHIPEHLSFEGEGDALQHGKVWVCGHGFRTDEKAHRWVENWTREPVMSVHLVAPHFYHLDTCFCPLRKGLALWHPEAFDMIGQNTMRTLVPELIEVTGEEARRFACNAIVSGSHVLLPEGCTHTERQLQDHGYQVYALPMSEFIKAGGACKCLALVLE